MPFKSEAQKRYLYAKNPEVAEEFSKHTPKSAYKNLPEHVKRKKAEIQKISLKRLNKERLR